MFSRATFVTLGFAMFIEIVFFGQVAGYAQISPAFALRGRVTTSIPAKSIRIVAENPKTKGVAVAETTADENGNYELANLHPSLQKALSETRAGEVTAPVLLDAGVEIFARCS